MPRERDDDHMTRLGQRIRARREWLGLSQTEVGGRAGIAYQQIYKYETGASDPPSGTLIRIAKALETTATALLGENGKGRDKHADAAAALFSDPAVASIILRLRAMNAPGRKQAHALICAIGRG